MFARSQQFYDAIYAWKDYAAEVERLDGLIRQHAPAARTLVDVACGTGTHLALLRGRYQVQGVDLDPQMIELARQRLGPDVALHAKDMVDFDLGRRFDVVTCLFSSIAYVRTPDALEQTVVNLARHVASGGMLIVDRSSRRNNGRTTRSRPTLSINRI